jgi:acetylglutamate kinase
MSKKKDNIVTPKAFIKYDDLAGELDILSKYIGIFAKIAGKTIVIKCGNGVLSNREAMYSMAKDIAVLQSSGVRVIVVHGGGAKIGEMLKIVGGLEKFIDGERVIDEAHFHIIEMVLKGSIAPHIVSDINHVGGIAISISGRDNNFIKTDKMRRIKKDPGSEIERIVELGESGLVFVETILCVAITSPSNFPSFDFLERLVGPVDIVVLFTAFVADVC